MSDESQSYPSFSDDPDVKLMLEFARGNRQAFEKLMTTHYSRVLNFIYKYVMDRALAEDLTQEVFIRVYQSASRYSANAKFITWVFTIAKNLSLNEMRRLRKAPVSLDRPVTNDGVLLKDIIEDSKAAQPGGHLVKEEKARVILQAINALPDHQKTAVILRRYEDLSYSEIAQIMGTTVKAVKSLLNRAKETLRQKLAHLLE